MTSNTSTQHRPFIMSDKSHDSDALGEEIQKEWAEFTKDTERARREMQETIDEVFEEKWTAGEITAIAVGTAVIIALLAIGIWKMYEIFAEH